MIVFNPFDHRTQKVEHNDDKKRRNYLCNVQTNIPSNAFNWAACQTFPRVFRFYLKPINFRNFQKSRW